MFKNFSIRLRITMVSALLLAACCVGLTFVLNFSAGRMVDEIDATKITTPATAAGEWENNAEDTTESMILLEPAETLKSAQKGFRAESILYMIAFVLLGSGITYYMVGKALKPLAVLNRQVKTRNVKNLSETLEVPKTRDEVAQLTQSFNEMTEQLNHAFAVQQRFSASAAHELRTPLAVLQTKVDVFHKGKEHTREEYEGLISVCEKQIGRLRNLVGSLLAMTNMEEDGEVTEICVRNMMKEIRSELAVLAQEKEIAFSLECDDSRITGNPGLIHRVFYNIIENGIKYNQYGGRLEILVQEQENKGVSVQIRDTGIGIPKEYRKTIFEPFYRIDKSRSRKMGGAGLGLSIVDSIIKKQGGSIFVSDVEGGGTCFNLVFK